MSFVSSFRQGVESGLESKRARTLRDSFAPALQGDTAALSEIGKVDPDAYMKVQGHVQTQAKQQKADVMDGIIQSSRLLKAAPDSQKQAVYAQWKANLEAHPEITKGMVLPDMYEPGALEVANVFAPNEQAESYTLAPGSRRFDANGQLIAEAPFAPKGFDGIWDSDRGVWITKPGAAGPEAPQIGGGSAPAQNWDPQDVQKTYQNLGATHGFEITSMQRPVLADVGAGARSQHPKGTAVDYRTAGKTPLQIAALKADLEAQGFEVIDESDGKTGTGPHLHAELPPGVRRQAPASAGGVSAIPVAGIGPKAEKPMTAAQKIAADNAAQRLILAQRADERAQRLAENGKPPTEGQLAGAGFLQRMEASELELQALTDSGYNPGNIRDANTAGQGWALNWAASEQGQHYRQQQEDFVRAKLRKESGASIPSDEMDREIETYFPQPGDKKDVIESKARSRQRAIKQMQITAGRAVGGDGAPPAAPKPPTTARPQSEAEYNALPSGAMFIDPDDGKTYRKP